MLRGAGRDTLRPMPENRFVDDVARTYDRTVARMFAPEGLDPEALTSGDRAALDRWRQAMPWSW